MCRHERLQQRSCSTCAAKLAGQLRGCCWGHVSVLVLCAMAAAAPVLAVAAAADTVNAAAAARARQQHARLCSASSKAPCRLLQIAAAHDVLPQRSALAARHGVSVRLQGAGKALQLSSWWVKRFVSRLALCACMVMLQATCQARH